MSFYPVCLLRWPVKIHDFKRVEVLSASHEILVRIAEDLCLTLSIIQKVSVAWLATISIQTVARDCDITRAALLPYKNVLYSIRKDRIEGRTEWLVSRASQSNNELFRKFAEVNGVYRLRFYPVQTTREDSM